MVVVVVVVVTVVVEELFGVVLSVACVGIGVLEVDFFVVLEVVSLSVSGSTLSLVASDKEVPLKLFSSFKLSSFPSEQPANIIAVAAMTTNAKSNLFIL